MSDLDTKNDETDVSKTAATSSETKELTPIQKLDQESELAYKELKSTGKLPDGLTPEVEFVVSQKKIARDSQATYTKNNQELIKVKAEHKVLRDLALQVAPQLTSDQKEELEDLKFEDPEAWRLKLNQYEAQAKQSRETEISEDLTKSSTAAIEADRLEKVKKFSQKTGIELNDDVIANDIPPRITQKLHDGNIDFDQYLKEVGRFLKTGKVVQNTETKEDKSPDFDDASGSQSSDNAAAKLDFATAYARNEADF